MIFDELPTSLVWYKERGKQHRWRENCQGELFYPLWTPQENFLPFQFRFSSADSLSVVKWEIYDVCNNNTLFPGENITDESIVDITDEDLNPLISEDDIGAGSTPPLYILDSADIALLEIVTSGSYKNVIYKGQALSILMACGYYESRIEMSDETVWWSEVFRVTNRVAGVFPFLQFTWSHTCNLGGIIYSTGYENKIYLDSFLSHSEPALLEEVEKDGEENEVLVFSKLTYKYRMSEIVPDYLKTVFLLMAMHKYKKVIDKNRLQEAMLNRITMTTSPEAGGCYSFIDMLLENDVVLTQTACC